MQNDAGSLLASGKFVAAIGGSANRVLSQRSKVSTAKNNSSESSEQHNVSEIVLSEVVLVGISAGQQTGQS